jgi:hypothetical protein
MSKYNEFEINTTTTTTTHLLSHIYIRMHILYLKKLKNENNIIFKKKKRDFNLKE